MNRTVRYTRRNAGIRSLWWQDRAGLSDFIPTNERRHAYARELRLIKINHHHRHSAVDAWLGLVREGHSAQWVTDCCRYQIPASTQRENPFILSLKCPSLWHNVSFAPHNPIADRAEIQLQGWPLNSHSVVLQSLFISSKQDEWQLDRKEVAAVWSIFMSFYRHLTVFVNKKKDIKEFVKL